MDLSNAEISVEGEYGYCLMCGELFHWEQLTNTEVGSYCDNHTKGEIAESQGWCAWCESGPWLPMHFLDGMMHQKGWQPLRTMVVKGEDT